MSIQPLGPLQDEWLQALESGLYQQCTSLLFSPGFDCRESYCCLGLASQVCESHGTRLDETNEELLENSVQRRMKFRSEDGGIESEDKPQLHGKRALSEANDDGATFRQIAAFVREDPSRVFTGPA